MSDGSGRSLGEELQTVRSSSYVSVHTVATAGHHVHADQPDSFCEIVNGACGRADRGDDRVVQPQAAVDSQGEGESEWDPSNVIGSK